MDQMLHVSSNPHVRDKMTTSKIMQLVVLALLPTTLFGIYNFGLRALLVVVITVASSVFFEWIYDKLMHKKNTITDFSAVVTGLSLIHIYFSVKRTARRRQILRCSRGSSACT